MADAVEYHLRHGALPRRIGSRLVQHGGGEAVGGAGEVFRAIVQAKGTGGGVGAADDGDAGIESARLVGWQVDERDRLDRRQCGGRHYLLADEHAMRPRHDARCGEHHGDGQRDRSGGDEGQGRTNARSRWHEAAHCSGRKSGTDR